MSVKHATTLLTSRRFVPLFGAQLFGAFNDQFLKLALITLVTYKELSIAGVSPEVITPIAGAVFTAPFFFFSAMAGQVADKYDKALILLRVKQAEILIMLLAAMSLIFNSPSLMLVILAFMGAQSAFFSPTRNAVLPQWLNDKELITGNSLLNGFVSVAILLGQAFGIFLIVLNGGPEIVAGILLVFAVLGWLAIRQAPAAPPSSPDIKIDKWVFPEIIKTLRFAYHTPRVFKPMLGTAWYYWLGAGVLILMPTYIKSVLHYERTVFILIMVLFTLGALFGAISCMMLSKGKGEAVLVSAFGALGITLSTFDLFIIGSDVTRLAFEAGAPASSDASAVLGSVTDFLARTNSWRFMFDLALASFSASLFVIPLNAMAQRRSDPQHRARLLAAGALLLNAATTLSQLLVAAINAAELPSHLTFIIISSISGMITIYVFYRVIILKKEAI